MAERKTQNVQKVVKKKRHPLKKLTTLVLFVVACFLIYDSMKEVVTTIQLKQSIAASDQEIEKIKKETKALREQKKNLEDPDYVKMYARGKFMVTKKEDGEQVFKLPSKE